MDNLTNPFNSDLAMATAVVANKAIAGKDIFNAVVIPNDHILVSLEPMKAHRNRFRGTYHTTSIPAFFAYVKYRKPADETQGFITSSNNKLKCITYFNLGNTERAGHADDIAEISLENTPEYLAFRSTNNHDTSQRHLCELLEDWQDFITPVDSSGAEIELSAALAAIRNIKITNNSETTSQVADLSASRSALENIEAKALKGSLPSGFMLHTPVYEGLPSKNLTIRLSVLTTKTEPTLKLRIVSLGTLQYICANEFKEIITGTLDEHGTFLAGEFSA